MRVLLDTNAYSALLRGHAGVAERVRRAEEVLVSAVVAGELMFGFRNGTRYEANRRELDEFLANPYVKLLPVTLVTVERFGRIAAGHYSRSGVKAIPASFPVLHSAHTNDDVPIQAVESSVYRAAQWRSVECRVKPGAVAHRLPRWPS